MNFKVILGSLLLFSSSFCSAQITADIYGGAKGTPAEKIHKVYISGAGAAFDWANVKMQVAGQKPLYCPPQELALNAENYISILDREISKYPASKQTPIELILIDGLIGTFPCKK
jgi:hypothetical protein